MEMLEPDGGPIGAVLVVHSWWGLTESFRRYGAALASAGFRTGLADLFDGQVASTAAEAKALRARPRKRPMHRTLSADLETLRETERGGPMKLGVVGFSMGGHWAVWLAQRPEYRIVATVLYYAARGGSFDHSRSDFLAHFADRDDWVSSGARKRMERAIGASGGRYQGYDYPGTRHWFAESERHGEFDASSARRALDRDLDFLRLRLS